MIKRHLIILFIFLLFFVRSGQLTAQFSENEYANIRLQLENVLSEYDSRLKQIAIDSKDVVKAKREIENLIKIFVSRNTLIYNDLDPSYNLSEFYDIETYLSNLLLWYPNGAIASINLKGAKISNIMSHGENIYSVDIFIEKQMSGFYLKNVWNSNSEKLLIRVAFENQNGSARNFKIAGIRKAGSDRFMGNEKDILDIKSAVLLPDEIQDIDNTLKTLLKDYGNYLNLITDTAENQEDKVFYKESFINLFSSRSSLVYNDFVRESRRETKLPVEQYINLLGDKSTQLKYTQFINYDSLKFGKVLNGEENNLIRFAYLNKNTSYVTSANHEIKSQTKLIFKFSFERINGLIKNYRIENIDLVDEKKTETVPVENFVELFAKARKTRIVLAGFYGKGQVNDPDISNLNFANNNHQWTITDQKSFAVHGRINYLITKHIELETGLTYSKIGTNYSLNSYAYGDSIFKDKTSYLDVNEEPYYKIIQANYDSTLALHYLEIPLQVTFFANPLRRGIFIKPGITLGFLFYASYSLNGFIKYYGNYYSHVYPFKKYVDWEEFGFYTRTYNNKTGTLKNKTSIFLISPSISIGYNQKIYKRFDILIEAYAKYSISDLQKSSGSYIDVFGKTETNLDNESNHISSHLKTNVVQYGIIIGLSYEL